MSMDLTGITNKNEYYTNHYFSTVFEENASTTISAWNAAAKESEEVHTPWSMLRQNARQFYAVHDRFTRSSLNMQALNSIRTMADAYLESLGYPNAKPENIAIDDTLSVPIYLEMTKSNGAPLLWVLLSASKELDAGILESYVFDSNKVEEDATGTLYKGILHELVNEDLATKILFGQAEPPRFLLFVGMNQIALVDRNKWNEKRYLQFDLEEIFARNENTTLQAMSVLMHKDSLCPEDGKVLLDELDEQSQKNASGVSQDLKYALRESIELLGNEVLYDMKTRLGRDLEADPVDAGQLTIECLRYMYRMLFVLFIESRPELGYAPIKAQSYYSGYSLESLRDIADQIRDDVDEVGDGYYLHETLAKLYELIYDGYPKTEDELKKATTSESLHDMFLIAPLKAHIFDSKYTKMLKATKLRNSCMLRIIDLMSLTRSTGKKNSRRGRISYANLGINQMGAVYEALLSYRGFIAKQDLYEVKRAGDKFNELDVGYFVSEQELDQYEENERVRMDDKDPKSKLRMYQKGTFIYRLAGREREKSASYYTPEVLTKCLVKYALKELLEGKTSDEILELTVCEPAMGSAAFLNEAINQLAEAYITKKEQETGEIISYDKRFNELQKVKMYIADRNVYGIDLNPVAVELAEVSLWLNTIYEGGYVPWFGTQLINGNSLIGARRQVYSEGQLQASSKGLRWYENEPERVPIGTERKKRRGNSQIYHFLIGDPGMCNYSDKVIKSLEPDKIKIMKDWNKKFTAAYTDGELETLRQLSLTVDELWNKQIELRKTIEKETQDVLSIYGHVDAAIDSHTTIRQKDEIYSKLYRSEHMRNAGPYARLKFAMDYWCALWFWPIDKADMLPSRSEFLNDLNLILVGTIPTGKGQARIGYDQLSLFDEDDEELRLIHKINAIQGTDKSEVDLDSLCMLFPRFELVRKIANQNKFMHWELEFADLFAEKGGFDLIIGNPPWITVRWDETSVLSDYKPAFIVKKLSAVEIVAERKDTLQNRNAKDNYFAEYVELTGQQNFLNAGQNYALLEGMKANLYKCFLPLAWGIGTLKGVSAFIHPDGVYDDPKGGLLREEIYARLCYHFQFRNELSLFAEVAHQAIYSINVYCNKKQIGFKTMSNLFAVKTIDESFEHSGKGNIPNIKDEFGWCTKGHLGRIVNIDKKKLALFGKLFDNGITYSQARMPVIHGQVVAEILEKIGNYPTTIRSEKVIEQSTVMWDETKSQKEGIIINKPSFSEDTLKIIYCGPNIGLANPIFKAARNPCIGKSDYDVVDLLDIDKHYMQRFKYVPCCELSDYVKRSPGEGKYMDSYRIIMREMLNNAGERSMIPAIIPPKCGHIITVFGLKPVRDIFEICGVLSSLVSDFYIKVVGRDHCQFDIIASLPHFQGKIANAISVRAGMLNCLSDRYADIWKREFKTDFCNDSWSKKDKRLEDSHFSELSFEWNMSIPLRSDYERRQALIELDVLVALGLGLTIEQLKNAYEIQFPVLQQYEDDTWYDANGRIVFTNNRSLVGVGFERKLFEQEVKNASAGKKFYRTIMDDTMPGGPIERTIEYVAPFDRCDREQDYETAWKFFADKYK